MMASNIYPIIFSLVFLVVSSSQSSVYTLIKQDEDQNARCLDGSPSALYISQGQTDKILVYFEGGGACSGLTLEATIQSCLARSKTKYGSSKSYPQTIDLENFSIMSNNEDTNPLYASWTKVYIPYCDGGLHQGSKQSPISFKGTNLYFRGANNTKAHFNYLQKKYNFYQAENIVLTGTSAGAIAATSWGNYVYNQAENKGGILVISDSGLFVSDFFNPFTNSTPGVDQFKFLTQIINTETPPPYEECLEQYGQACDTNLVIKCLKPPIFIIQSEYDMYAIPYILKIKCAQGSFPASLKNCNATEMAVIEKYRAATRVMLDKVAEDSKNAIWAISCAQHGFLYDDSFYFSQNYVVPTKTGKSILEILAGFVMRAGQKINIDEAAWPDNVGCNGIKKENLLKQ